MRSYFILVLFSAFINPNLKLGQEYIVLSNSKGTPISDRLYVLDDPEALLTVKEVISKKEDFVKSTNNIGKPGDQWLKFSVFNPDSISHDAKVSIAFVDFINCYIKQGSSLILYKTGDLLPIKERNFPIGQLCLVGFNIPAGKTVECFLHLHSSTDISKQFRSFSIRSVQLYSEQPFIKIFETSRIYQALFFGAIIMMVLYNFFIFSTTRSPSYISYVAFLISLLVFIASNNGYIVELLLQNVPRTDLYIRILSAPITLIAFLIFARQYLESAKFTPKLNTLLSVLIISFILIIISMISGFWQMGRNLTIIMSVTSFVFSLILAFTIMRRGYTPARYFIIANILLVGGAVFYSLERYYLVIQNPLTQYSVQLSVIFQSVFFSIGLADRIKLAQLQIANFQVEKERLETLRQTERKNLIEEKNIALEFSNRELDAFIYKTAHDIRGPIARLMGLSNVGLIEVKDLKSITYLTMLKNNAYYLNYLINRLSTSYEIRKKEIAIAEFDIKKLISEDVLKELSFHEEFENITINLEILNGLSIFSDQILMRFILINLLENAVKFKNKDSIVVNEVKLKVQIINNWLTINVVENGIGIKEDDIPYVFEMFSKAAGKYKTPGLGLYMTKLSVEKLGGTIQLIHSSGPTEFEVKIPL
ncbi:MAG: sensor histidine kinase [Opitutaceae bacterium]|nr:sensor histidine kinase [Cytophagales bacterium]